MVVLSIDKTSKPHWHALSMPIVDIISSYVSISTPKQGSKSFGHENFKGDYVKTSSPMTTEPLKNKNKNKKKNE